MPTYFPVLLGAHIILAVSLVLPSILLPFALRTRRAAVESGNGVVRSLLFAQTHGTLAIGIELSVPYFLDGAAYCKAAEEKMSMPDLFDLTGDAPESSALADAVEDVVIEEELKSQLDERV